MRAKILQKSVCSAPDLSLLLVSEDVNIYILKGLMLVDTFVDAYLFFLKHLSYWVNCNLSQKVFKLRGNDIGSWSWRQGKDKGNLRCLREEI